MSLVLARVVRSEQLGNVTTTRPRCRLSKMASNPRASWPFTTTRPYRSRQSASVLAVRSPGIQVQEDGERASWPFTNHNGATEARSISTQENKRAAWPFTTAWRRQHLIWSISTKDKLCGNSIVLFSFI
jgi:hypothetical protein